MSTYFHIVMKRVWKVMEEKSKLNNVCRELINRNRELMEALAELSDLKEREHEKEITTLGDLGKGFKVYLRRDGSKRMEKINE